MAWVIHSCASGQQAPRIDNEKGTGLPAQALFRKSIKMTQPDRTPPPFRGCQVDGLGIISDQAARRGHFCPFRSNCSAGFPFSNLEPNCPYNRNSLGFGCARLCILEIVI